MSAGFLGVGIQLPVQAQSSIFVEDWERHAGPGELAAVAEAADERGYLYVGVCDHAVIPAARVERMGAVWYDPLTTLAWLAARTGRVRLLTHVLALPLHHPLRVAKAAATVDRLSGGRLILGVGTGHVEEEFAALDVDRSRRGQLLDEGIDAVRAALTDEMASHAGEAFGFEDLAVAPRPVQQPPPVWVGGSSPAALRRAGERGDGWLPQGTLLKDMPAAVDAIRSAATAAGRDPDGIDVGGMPLPLYVGEPDWDVGDWTTAGTADELAAHLRDWIEVGCSHLQIRLRSRSAGELLEQLAAFAAGVMPHLAT